MEHFLKHNVFQQKFVCICYPIFCNLHLKHMKRLGLVFWIFFPHYYLINKSRNNYFMFGTRNAESLFVKDKVHKLKLQIYQYRKKVGKHKFFIYIFIMDIHVQENKRSTLANLKCRRSYDCNKQQDINEKSRDNPIIILRHSCNLCIQWGYVDGFVDNIYINKSII